MTMTMAPIWWISQFGELFFGSAGSALKNDPDIHIHIHIYIYTYLHIYIYGARLGGISGL